MLSAADPNNSTTKNDFTFLDTLGTGGYGEVKLAVHNPTGRRCAVKIIPKKVSLSPQQAQQLKKEILIHRAVHHPNIVQLWHVEEDTIATYMFVELAAGGELFDKIEPDLGLDEQLCHFYFTQLIHALQYIHEQGISHRDIKPENMLLDYQGNLKVSDFGLSTVFRHRGVVRKLNTPCGTPVYMAPEVYKLEYDGAAIDIWSAGVVLFVLLIGNTPWDEPTENSEEFCLFLSRRQLDYSPWTRLGPSVLDLLRRILEANPDQRFNIAQIREHGWFNQPNAFLNAQGQCSDPQALAERLLQRARQVPTAVSAEQDNDVQMMALSQPEAMFHQTNNGTQSNAAVFSVSSSQPIAVIDPQEEIASSPILMASRLTRFYSATPVALLLSRIQSTLESFLVQSKPLAGSHQITFVTVDRRKCPLGGTVTIHSVPGRNRQLVVFQKTRGDPLEFKRFYRALHDAMADVIVDST